MPLVWAHAEFIKLWVSRQRGHPIDRPAATWDRYQGVRPVIEHAIWLPQSPIQTLGAGQTLLIAMLEPGIIRWGLDGWLSVQDTATQDSGLGIHVAELETRTLHVGQSVNFTSRRVGTGEWLGHDFTIAVESGEA